MDKHKLKVIIFKYLESIVEDISYSDEQLNKFSDELMNEILDYNDSIIYRKYDYDIEKKKWVLKECR